MTSNKHSAQYFGKVAVMMGGDSSEREISLQSGQAVLNALLRQDIDAYAIDSNEALLERLSKEKFDLVFIALHGRGGEDGKLQGMLDMLHIPYTGSDLTGSAVAMNKCLSKRVWQACGLPTPKFAEINESTDWEVVVKNLGLPMIVKPVREGSSYGASRVEDVDVLYSAWKKAHEYDDLVMAERWIEGTEYTASILHDQVLPLILLQTPRNFYDYKAKYIDDNTRYVCPCGLPSEIEKELQELSLKAYQALGLSGWGRVDLMLDNNADPFLLEVNTVPGLTDHSLVPMASEQAGIGFDELIVKILETAL